MKRIINIKLIKFITIDLIMILILFISIINFSFSWLPRSNNIYIDGNNLQVEVNGGLSFILDNGASNNSVSINQYYNLSNFYLKPVSSLNGERDTFYGITYNNNSEGDLVLLSKSSEVSYANHAINNGFIDFTFYITNETLTNNRKYIYFSENSKIENTDPNLGTNLFDAIRVAITLDEDSDDATTYLFRASMIYPHYAVIQEGPSYINNNINQSVYSTNINLHFFHRYFVNEGFLNEVEALDTSKAFFVLEPNEVKKITIKIWLEGRDANDFAIGNYVNVYIGFVGYCDE